MTNDVTPIWQAPSRIELPRGSMEAVVARCSLKWAHVIGRIYRTPDIEAFWVPENHGFAKENEMFYRTSGLAFGATYCWPVLIGAASGRLTGGCKDGLFYVEAENALRVYKAAVLRGQRKTMQARSW